MIDNKLFLEFESLNKEASKSFLEYFAATMHKEQNSYAASGIINKDEKFELTIPYSFWDDKVTAQCIM